MSNPACNSKRNVVRIPEKLSILGIDYKIVYTDNLACSENASGQVDYLNHVTSMQKSIPGYKTDFANIERTLLHEVIHIIMREMQQNDLHNDEKFIDQLSHFLYAVQKDNRIFI